MIKFSCQVCHSILKVEDKHAGKIGRCPQCKELVKIPFENTQLNITPEGISKKNFGEMTHDEASHFYQNQRQDEAKTEQQTTDYKITKPPSVEPVCPYCKNSIGNRKTPTRRSNFKCKKCSNQIYVDPTQKVFESVYLTKNQSVLVYYLWKLDRWIFTAGTIEDYLWAKSKIGKACHPNTENVAADTIWFLLKYNLKNIKAINPHGDNLSYQFYQEDIVELMRSFKEDLKK
jgi:ribosomal protein L37AE/L43A